MKIKVLYLITGLNIGGAEVFLLRFLRKLDRSKFDPIVVSFIPIGEIGEQMIAEGIRVDSLGITKVLSGENKGIFTLVNRIFAVLFKEIPHLIQIVRRERPKIIHAHLFHANFTARIIGFLCGVPIIISTIHNVNFGGRLREVMLALTDCLGDVTVAISEAVAEKMLENRVVPRSKLVTIQNGIDVSEFMRSDKAVASDVRGFLNVGYETKLLLSVGRLSEQKGYPFLLQAISTLRNEGRDVVLVILGEGEERIPLEELASKLGIQDYVHMLGSGENVRKYLHSCDVFVMPSLWEGLPIALLEAMASDVPVVVSRVGGVPEVVVDKQSGFLVNPGDSSDLAAKLVEATSLSENEKKSVTENAYEVVVGRFSIANTYSHYEKLYLEYLSKSWDH